ncbi:MAG: S8 family serine peptidase, partial [Halobacteriales archaeon]|nr:S8 family serine peptidase [Halobacteriales archaeon]
MRRCLAPLLVAALLAPAALAQSSHGVIVQFARAPTPDERALLALHGVRTFVSIVPAAIGDASPADEAWLRAQPFVARVDADQPLERTDAFAASLIRSGGPLLDLGFDGSGVTVAVLDSGIDASHPDVAGRVLADVSYVNGGWQSISVDTDGHGSHVAGIIAGNGAASAGLVQGIAPGAGLVGMDFTRAFTTSTALQAMDWVLKNKDRYHIRVVQNSWGRADNPTAWDPGDSIIRASNRLVDEGLVVIFSAGNKGPEPGSVSLEGRNPNVITVGAVDAAGLSPAFSGRGPVRDGSGAVQPWIKPDVVADGVDIASIRSGQAVGKVVQPQLVPTQLPGLGQGVAPEAARYTTLSGTSQAAPQVAGLAAVMLQANPRLTPGQVHNLLRSTAIDLGAPGPDDATGFGLVDARDAVLAAQGQEADHGNVLLRGGEETFDASGTIATATGQLVQTSPVVQVRQGGMVEATFPVKAGATAARFDFSWSPVTVAFQVYLVGPAQTLGPWSTSRTLGTERTISGGEPGLAPGVYKLVARPTGVASVSYHATMTATIREQAQLPAQLSDRYR